MKYDCDDCKHCGIAGNETYCYKHDEYGCHEICNKFRLRKDYKEMWKKLKKIHEEAIPKWEEDEILSEHTKSIVVMYINQAIKLMEEMERE